jgi:hypothetical protein
MFYQKCAATMFGWPDFSTNHIRGEDELEILLLPPLGATG